MQGRYNLQAARCAGPCRQQGHCAVAVLCCAVLCSPEEQGCDDELLHARKVHAQTCTLSRHSRGAQTHTQKNSNPHTLFGLCQAAHSLAPLVPCCWTLASPRSPT